MLTSDVAIEVSNHERKPLLNDRVNSKTVTGKCSAPAYHLQLNRYAEGLRPPSRTSSKYLVSLASDRQFISCLDKGDNLFDVKSAKTAALMHNLPTQQVICAFMASEH